MADVKWVKITTDMFDNRKIKHLRRLPDGNNIVLIWVMLLTMAGRCNAGGMIFLTENIPYTPKMLADELDFEENTVLLALRSLEEFNMIAMDGKMFRIAGWEEYQNIEGMDRIREQNRLRKQRQREQRRLQAAAQPQNPVQCDGHVTVTPSHATDIEGDIDIKKGDTQGIIDGSDTAEPPTPPPPPSTPDKPKPVKHKYGEYKNVLLTDVELDKLKAKTVKWKDWIERLSSYMESTGKKYKSHYATILNWVRDEEQKAAEAAQRVQRPVQQQNNYNDFMVQLAAMRE